MAYFVEQHLAVLDVLPPSPAAAPTSGLTVSEPHQLVAATSVSRYSRLLIDCHMALQKTDWS
jgi:hypothetical protein